MSLFHEELLKDSAGLWNKIVSHPFLTQTAEGTIPEDIFKTWVQQDYIFVREAIPFMAVLLAKGPVSLRSNFIQIMVGLDKELELFRSNAQRHGISLEDIQPSPTCHAYIQFLMNTAYNASFEEGFTVLYSAEKVYLDSWMAVKTNLKGSSPWQEFIDNWTSEAFQQYVDWLAQTLNILVKDHSAVQLQNYREIFNITGQYEYLFWEMASKKESWPVQ
jgi:thiaminase